LAEFRLLGPIEVEVKGRPIEAGRPRQRAVLAALLVDAGRVVPRGALVDRVWGDSPPDTVEATLRAHVTRIRRVLEQAAAADGETVRLVSSSGGYLLDVDPDQVDLYRFRRLLRTVQDAIDDADKAVLLRRALAMWRGQPMSGVGGEWAARTRESWNRERVDASVQWADAEIATGNAASVLGPLGELSAEHPLVESLTGAMMRSLHAAGRTVEALDTYSAARRRLVEELGIDPGAELQALHRSLLRADVGRTSAVPAQLPADVYAFAGRTEPLADLDALLTEPGSRPPAILITAVSGTAGVGKTALAVHWAHRVADRFPDGTLYVNLRGFDPGRPAMEPAEAIRGFLDALGVPPADIPRGLDAQAARYRSLINGRRMLVVLDNARDAEQVRPLLPGTPATVVVATSRNQLTGLVVTDGAHPVTLDLMSPAESRELLTRLLGPERMRREAAAADRIVTLCAGLPLALTIVGARTRQSGFPLAALADELGTGRQLDALDAGDALTRARAVFSWSYQALTPGAAGLFRLLGLHPGADMGFRAAVSLAGGDEDGTRDRLAELTRASLLTEHTPGRYAMHDLLRAYAGELADPASREAALGRLVDHYLHSAAAADRLLHPSRPASVIPLTEAAPGTLPDAPDDPVTWFNAERRNVLAVVGRAGDDTRTWQLAWAIDTALERQGHWHDLGAIWELALGSATRLGDKAAQAYSHRRRARASMLLGREAETENRLHRALELYEAAGDLVGQAAVHHSLSSSYDWRHEPEDALRHAQLALACCEQADYRSGLAIAFNAVGWCHAQLGDYVQALAHCRQALPLVDPRDLAQKGEVWDSIGFAHQNLGEHDQAVEAYGQGLALARRAGARHLEATILGRLGDTHHAVGDPVAARAAWQPALDILLEINPAAAAPIRDRLAALVRT
jgi:DNA-binding SARP family transcriptional activator/tetratricopeptide (TPR) repeat protein